MAKNNTIIGLDVGTTKIRVAIASVKNIEEKPKIIGAGETASSGMRKGVIVDIDEVTENIRNAVNQAELNSGVPIHSAYVSVGGAHINIRENKGLVAVSRADQEVSEEDIVRVIDFASAISLPPNREVIHVIPRSFKLDNEGDVQDPLGMTGARLEVDALIIDGLSPHIKNLAKCVSGLGIKIDGFVLNILAASESVLSKRQKELGVLVLDLGGGTSSMAVYEEGKLLYTHVLPVGSDHITNDIAIGLRTSVDLAEKIKLQYGSALPLKIKKKDIIRLSDLDETAEGEITKQEVAKIIEARAQEIFDLVNKELKRIGRQRLLPAGVVLVGGGSMMPGIVDLAKREFGLPAQIGFPSEVEGIIEKVNDPAFATATGLVLWALRMEGGANQKSILSSGIHSASDTVSKLKKWFRAFLP